MDRETVDRANLRTAFPRQESPLLYDPANIQFAYEYIFLESVYSPLVEYNENGELQPAIARKFWWDNNELYLEIRDDFKTIDGHTIGPDDVIFSLKRVMLLGGNTHGNLSTLLCRGHNFKHIDQACPGLRSQGNTVILSPDRPTPFLTAMLTGIDFAIIPRIATEPRTLKITDMRNTTGPMYLDSISANGQIRLKANRGHFNYNRHRPETITLISGIDPITGTSKALEMFDKNKVDLITTIDSVSSEEVIRYHEANSSSSALHSSMDIRIFLMRFSTLGLSKFNLDTRFSIGRSLVKSFRETFQKHKSFKETDQIVPSYGEGSLEPEQILSIKSRTKEVNFDRQKAVRVYLIRLPDIELFEKAVRKIFPNAVFIDSSQTKLENWGDDDSDIIISGPDMGFVEDISLYSYALKGGIFRAPEGADQWLDKYMKVMKKEERIEMIRKIHLYNLEQGFAFPIFATPYVALSRKPWQITLPKMFANHPLWQILYQP